MLLFSIPIEQDFAYPSEWATVQAFQLPELCWMFL